MISNFDLYFYHLQFFVSTKTPYKEGIVPFAICMYEQGNFSAVEMGELGNLEYSSGAYFQMTTIGCIKQIEVLSPRDFSLKFRGIALQEYIDLENDINV